MVDLLFLKEYLDLRDRISDLEAAAEKKCNCDSANFHCCPAHEKLGELRPRYQWLQSTFADCWAWSLRETLEFVVKVAAQDITYISGPDYIDMISDARDLADKWTTGGNSNHTNGGGFHAENR